jgi:predicted metal-dependent phosphoesterase TrpH
MAYADLHVHTTRSDGTLDLAAVPQAAREAGVRVVGLTDHDRLQPFDEPAITRDGVRIIHGIELRVEIDADLRVDLLGYGIAPTEALESELDRIQRNRRERGQAIVERVEDYLDITLSLPIADGIGRPHIARAIDDNPETHYDYDDAFRDLIGNDCPCYVPRAIPSFERGRDLLQAAGELVSLAHPLRYGDVARALERAATLDAVELHYPYGNPVDLTPVDRAIETHDLLVTGGSDAHGEELGIDGLSEDAFSRLPLSRLAEETNANGGFN